MKEYVVKITNEIILTIKAESKKDAIKKFIEKNSALYKKCGNKITVV